MFNSPSRKKSLAKKLAVIILIISPLLLALFIGYPVRTYRTTEEKGIILSKRCFKVGELGEFVRCFQSGKRISGRYFIANLQTSLSSLFPLFDVIFFGGVLGLILLLVFF